MVDDGRTVARLIDEPMLVVGHSSGEVVALEAMVASPAGSGLPIVTTLPAGGEGRERRARGLRRAVLGHIQDMEARKVDKIERAFPVGLCYCGCGTSLEDPKAFFVQGHDKRAEGKVIRECYGNVANFLLAHGYGPKERT